MDYYVIFGITLAISGGLFTWITANWWQDVVSESETQYEVYSPTPFFRFVLPFVQMMGRSLDKGKVLQGLRNTIGDRLVHAGRSLVISPGEFIGYMFAWGAVIGGTFLGLCAIALGDLPGLSLIIVAMVLSTYFPLFLLSKRVKARQKLIQKILPYTLDLLCLAVEAGLDFTAALNRIGENLGTNPLGDEFRMLGQDLNMGKTRPEALRDLERRIGLEELTAVVSALVQADELGASLGPALRIQSEELQRQRFQRAEKKAMQAPVFMLLPMVGCIFPIVFMVIFTPIVLQIIDIMATL
ncbi:MAG: type II secretion system F family protein [Planctomycetes bacterium]|nr:type II secretion system F family protein [Planctomycetota bacterium]